MGAGQPDFVVVNLVDLEKHFEAGSEVTVDTVKAQVLSVTGREASLPLKVSRRTFDEERERSNRKPYRFFFLDTLDNSIPLSSPFMNVCLATPQVLGSGSLSKKLTVKAAAFSESAKAAIEAAGGAVEVVPQQAKWTRRAYKKAKEANPNYEADVLKKKIESLVAKVREGNLNGRLVAAFSATCVCTGAGQQEPNGQGWKGSKREGCCQKGLIF